MFLTDCHNHNDFNTSKWYDSNSNAFQHSNFLLLATIGLLSIENYLKKKNLFQNNSTLYQMTVLFWMFQKLTGSADKTNQNVYK